MIGERLVLLFDRPLFAWSWDRGSWFIRHASSLLSPFYRKSIRSTNWMCGADMSGKPICVPVYSWLAITELLPKARIYSRPYTNTYIGTYGCRYTCIPIMKQFRIDYFCFPPQQESEVLSALQCPILMVFDSVCSAWRPFAPVAQLYTISGLVAYQIQ